MDKWTDGQMHDAPGLLTLLCPQCLQDALTPVLEHQDCGRLSLRILVGDAWTHSSLMDGWIDG